MRGGAILAVAVGGVLIGLAPIGVRLSELGPLGTNLWRFLFALPILIARLRNKQRLIACAVYAAVLAYVVLAIMPTLWKLGAISLIVPVFFVLGPVAAFHPRRGEGLAVGFATIHLVFWGLFVWTLVLLFLMKVGHPPVAEEESLGKTRTVLAIIALLVFILCFMPLPITTISSSQ